MRFRVISGRVAIAFISIALAGSAFLMWNASGSVALDTQIQKELKKGYIALEYWDFGLADEIGRKVRTLLDSAPEPDEERELDWLRYQAYLCFYAGEYEEALNFADRANKLNGHGLEAWQDFYNRTKSLAQIWRGAKEERSEHFIFRYIPGPEEILVKPGLSALERSYRVLTRELQVKADRGPVLAEVYPSVAALSMAVGLSEKEMKDSGTIAICRYRRLMITSPRQLLSGYDYLTTLSHEFVHYLIYLRNGPKCPIWLHEGIAKHEESRWKGDPGGQLDPIPQSLLASAVKRDEFISFEQMYPTFAKFDSPAQGQLAFAEVVTVVDYLTREQGMPRLFELLDMLKQGIDDKEALARLTGKNFDQFWQGWKEYVATRNYKEIPGIDVPKLEFRNRETEQEDQQEDIVGEDDLASNEAWRYVRIGDLLRNRNHLAAAVMEYEKALVLLPYQPRIQNKLGLSLILMGNYRRALKPLMQAERIYPNYVTTYINMGRAYAGVGDTVKAISYFEKALTINPFDPTPYHYLIKLYENAGEPKRSERARERLRIISQR